ncbi:MAG TPA: hypothetical protein VI431_12545 [Candidatus Acidoferrum sp.]
MNVQGILQRYMRHREFSNLILDGNRQSPIQQPFWKDLGHSRIQSIAAKIPPAAAFAVMAFLVPSARPHDCPERREATWVNLEESSTEATPGACQDQVAAQESTQEKAGKKRSLFRSWLKMAEQVQATQPDWLSPLATTSGRLKQEFRYDIWDQPTADGNRTYQLGGNKGLEFIPSSRTQLLVGVPTYTLISPNGPRGGFGDLPLMLKFRIASAERAEGNYLLTFILAATAPTGSHRYGSGSGVMTPTLAFGKGWKSFDVQSTVGVNLPAGDTAKLGRQVLWNTAFQYQTSWKLWPELEANSTFYETGKHAGDTQLFLTPGLGFGRVHLAGRFRFSSALGMQIAATRFHSYDHRLMLSTRFSF